MIELYLGTNAGGWAVDGATQAWAPHSDALQGLDRWTREIAVRRASRWWRARVTLWLSGGLARPFLFGPVEGLAGWQDAETVAAAIAANETGLAGPCKVMLEGWPDATRTLAVAIDQPLAEALATLEREHCIAWASVRPWWAAALDEALVQRPSLRVLAVAEDDALTLIGGPVPAVGTTGLAAAPGAARERQGVTFDYATTYAPSPDAVDAGALWHRTLLAHDVLADDAWFGRLIRGEPLHAPAGDTVTEAAANVAAAAPPTDAAAASSPPASRGAIWPQAVWGIERAAR